MSAPIKKTILLVEDEPVTSMIGLRMLERNGFAVLTAASGEAAVEKSRSESAPDLVLMDIDLGRGIDGTEAARLILAEREVPVVFLSSHTEPAIVEKTEKITSYGYVVKNTGETVLLASIKMAFRLFEAHRRERENEAALKAKEEALVTERRNLQAILSASPVGMLVVDEDEKVYYANAAAKELFGNDGFEAGRCGDLIFCESRTEDPRGCGYSPDCSSCALYTAIRNSLAAGAENLTEEGESEVRCGPDFDRIRIRFKARSVKLDGRRRVVLAVDDITGRVRAEERIRLNESRLRSLLSILQYDAPTMQEFLDYALHEAIRLTDSRLGYIYFYSEEEKRFTLNTWSKEVMGECSVIDPQTVYDLDKTGIWGEAVRQRKPIVLNDYKAAHPLKKGYPQGHAALRNFMTVPVFSGDRIVATVGAANKPSDYNEEDVLQLTLLMDSVWKSVEKRKFEADLSAALKEKETLLKELQHRVKNSMAMITSLIRLEEGRREDASSRNALEDVRRRVSVLADLYNLLYESGAEEVRLDLFIQRISRSLLEAFSFGEAERTIQLDFRLTEAVIDPKRASSFGLILNELLTNAYKYAFPGNRGGRVMVEIARNGEELSLSVADDGSGLPEGFDPEKSGGFGFKLVDMLTLQLRGRFSWESSDRGTVMRVHIPEDKS
jgi:two-component sensor histidine kinase/CheY-like chemotaxis protein